MAVDMPGVGGNNALHWGQRRRDDDDIGLRCAGNEFYQCILV